MASSSCSEAFRGWGCDSMWSWSSWTPFPLRKQRLTCWQHKQEPQRVNISILMTFWVHCLQQQRLVSLVFSTQYTLKMIASQISYLSNLISRCCLNFPPAGWTELCSVKRGAIWGRHFGLYRIKKLGHFCRKTDDFYVSESTSRSFYFWKYILYPSPRHQTTSFPGRVENFWEFSDFQFREV